jgi:hypothetical protein
MTMERGHARNLLALYHHSTDWEKREGACYYDNQRKRIWRIGHMQHYGDVVFEQSRLCAAFAVLSPNQTEKTNYIALSQCCQIVTGRRPEDSSVSAYGKNKAKARAILRGGDIDAHIKGRKVRSFYHNTIDPDDSSYVTIDGHMLSVWCGRRILLKTREANLSTKEYQAIADDMRIAAGFLGYSAPRLQAILWLAWKRVNRIVYSPQTCFEWVAAVD